MKKTIVQSAPSIKVKAHLRTDQRAGVAVKTAVRAGSGGFAGPWI